LNLSNKASVLIALVFIAFISVKIFFFSHIFNDGLISDEIYYVTSAKYILYSLGLLPEFKPPVESTFKVENGTIVINATANENIYGINLLGGMYNWLNLEHPIAVKLIYSAIYFLTRSVVSIRFVQLVISLAVLFLLFRYFVSRYSLKAVIPIAILILLDGTYYHLTYLAFLDTLMLNLLLLGIYFVLKKKHMIGVILIGLTPLFKEVGIVFVFATMLYFYLLNDSKTVKLALAVSMLSIVVGYGSYLLFADPQQVLRAIGSIAGIMDPFACKYLCMFTLRYRWSAFDFYSFFLWIWIAGIVALSLKLRCGFAIEREELLSYFIALVYMLFLAFVQFMRSIYPFYFAPFIVLSIFPAKDVEELVLIVCQKLFIQRQ